MRSVPNRLPRFSLAARVAVATFAMFATFAPAAHAATLPAHAEVRAGRCVAATAFQQLVTARYHVEFRQVVATDIDRDGDIDVLATTDRSFTVWINDGAGHLTSQRPAAGPSIEQRPWSNTFRGQDGRPDPSVNADVPTFAVLTPRAHAPPVFASSRRTRRAASAFSFFLIASSAPRAPPLS